MNILFINPQLSHNPKECLLHPPLGIGMLSAMLKKYGHKVDLIDMPIENIATNDLPKYLSKYDPDLVGISAVSQTFKGAAEAATICKNYYKKVPIAMGGPHVTFIPYETLERHPQIDIIFMYEGDFTIVEVIDAIAGKRSFETIKNIAYRKDGKIIINSVDEPISNLNELPYTDRTIFNNKKYLDRDYETIVLSARGCPGKCKFCSTSKMGRRLRTFSIERLCDEIQECINMGFKSFFISDDNFGFSDKRITDFTNEVAKRKMEFKWTSNLRIIDINEYKIEKMKEAGAYRIFTGLETINSNSSKEMNKNINIDQILRAIEVVKNNDLEFHTSFIIGVPGDTDETLEETEKFINKIDPTIITLNAIRVYPGTEIHANPEKYGIILNDKYWYEKDDWTKGPVCGTKELSVHRIGYWKTRIMSNFIVSKSKFNLCNESNHVKFI